MPHAGRSWLAGLGLGALLAPAAIVMAGTGPDRPAPEPAAVPAGYRVLQKSCFKCHGEGTKLSDLDLRTRELALKGGKHGAAFVPGKAAASRLLQMVQGKAKPQMPPTGALPDADVAALRAWIDAGAPYPVAAKADSDGKWWAFRPVTAPPPVPAVKDPWVKTPIDAFLLARMQEAGIRPSPAADRVTLIRRATFDLHGLPPSPEEIDAFVNDRSPNAWEKVIDRLLASPRYGERWGRHWLDLARFAESEGFKADETRPNAWRYRDYVIRSMNADKPYDRFIMEQIAGDELWPRDMDARVATGFNRHYADESNAKNIPLRRQEILNDMTDTVGSVFLGLTVGCARCHDHKYDPITHRDYYSLQAFFAAVRPREDLALVPPEQLADHQRRLQSWTEQTRPVREEMAQIEAPYRAKVLKEKRAAFTPDVQDAIDTPAAKRTALQWQLFLKVQPQIEIKDDEMAKAMKGADKQRYADLQAELAKFDSLKPGPLPVCLGITDVARDAPKIHVLAVGNYENPKEEVGPAFPAFLDSTPPAIVAPADVVSTGRRTALAKWLASPKNPLTARVMVNRVWQDHFGRGLVPTASDFGKAGEPVTHPELLDYLAAVFSSPGNDGEKERGRDRATETPNGLGWSLKRLHRLLMTSAAYQQSSALPPSAQSAKSADSSRPNPLSVDPENRLLWRYRRWRLEGEAVRDACLAACGQLNDKMYGPSIFPELPEGVSTRGGWPVTKDESERNRRSVYVFVRRNLRYPLFEAFDFPDTHEPCARRNVTNTAPQALMLFNSALALKPAQAMAGRLLREAPTPEARVDRAYRLAFGRTAETSERDAALQFMKRQSGVIRARLDRKEPVALPTGVPDPGDPQGAAEAAALVDFCHALMNANEFLYVD